MSRVGALPVDLQTFDGLRKTNYMRSCCLTMSRQLRDIAEKAVRLFPIGDSSVHETNVTALEAARSGTLFDLEMSD